MIVDRTRNSLSSGRFRCSFIKTFPRTRREQKQKKKGSVRVFIFPPCRKGLHWWFWICCPFRDMKRFWPGLSFSFSSPSPCSHPGAEGELVKSAAIRCVKKIIQVLLGLLWEGGKGGDWGVKWLYSTIHLSPKKEEPCYILYWLAHERTRCETEESLEINGVIFGR